MVFVGLGSALRSAIGAPNRVDRLAPVFNCVTGFETFHEWNKWDCQIWILEGGPALPWFGLVPVYSEGGRNSRKLGTNLHSQETTRQETGDGTTPKLSPPRTHPNPRNRPVPRTGYNMRFLQSRARPCRSENGCQRIWVHPVATTQVSEEK